MSVNASQTQITSVGTLTGLTSSGIVSITSGTVSNSTISGALQVTGGVGVGGSIYAGNMFIGTDAVATQAYVTGLGYITSSALTPYLTSATAASTYLTSATAASTYQPTIIAGTGLTKTGNTLSVNAAQTQITSVGTLTGLTSSGTVSITSGTVSNSTISGALQVTGGVGVGGSIYAGNMFIGTNAVATQAYVTGLGYITSSALTPYLTSATAASTYLTTSTASSTYQPIITAGTGLTKSGNTLSVNAAQTQITSVGTLTGLTSSGTVSITLATDASSTTSGALQVTGGVGVGQSLFVSNRGIFGYSLGTSQQSYATGYINTDNSTVNVVSKTNNGGQAISAPEPVLNLVRNGVGAQSWSNFATFYLSRYENSGISARTQLDISLTHDDLTLGADVNAKVLRLRSDGTLFQNSIGSCLHRFHNNNQTALWWELEMEANNNFRLVNNNLNGVWLAYNANTWSSTSDLRLKRDIAPILTEGQLDKIVSLKPVTYRWKTDDEEKDATTKKKSGFIAQEVLKIFPEIVDETSEMLGITMTDLIPYLVCAFKELKQRNANLYLQVEELKQRDEDLFLQVEELKAFVNSKL